MNKKISLGAAIAFMVVIAGITFCITMMVSLNHFNRMVVNVKAREELYKRISDVDHEVRQNYANASQIDDDTLYDSISVGYIRGIGDKYAAFLTKDQYAELLAEQNGKRVSIGVTVEKDVTGYLKITKVAENSSGSQAGLQVDDLIISISNTDVKSLSQSNAERLLKGEEGTSVTLTFRRDGVDNTIQLTRKSIDTRYVESRMIGANGYINILEFNSKTFSQFETAVDGLIHEGATALILDVRNNNSDSISAASDMLNILLPSGELGSIIDKSGNRKSIGDSDRYSVSLPMCVLINSRTGCAAEYFAGTLKDFELANQMNLINTVGVTTLGKSEIQEILPLTDGSALQLTTSHFLTAAGTNISGIGIQPDYEVKLTADQEQSFPTLNEETDPQLKKAIEIVNSRQTTEE